MADGASRQEDRQEQLGEEMGVDQHRMKRQEPQPSATREKQKQKQQAIAKYHLRRCSYCGKQEDPLRVKLLVCGKCRELSSPDPALYCSSDCQRRDWKKGRHRGRCSEVPIEIRRARERSAGGAGVDRWEAWRKTAIDGSYHFGDLELMTWDYAPPSSKKKSSSAQQQQQQQAWTWGGFVKCHFDDDDDDDDEEEVEDLKRTFEVECGGDEVEFLERGSDLSFRWTCCGRTALEGLRSGCDHHGHPDSFRACRCTFCVQGVQVPGIVLQTKRDTQAAQGLKLYAGPDSRSSSLSPDHRGGGTAPTRKPGLSSPELPSFSYEEARRKAEAVYWGDDDD